MSTGQVAIAVQKLSHSLQEVRQRALKTLHFKLVSNLVLADDLVHESCFVDKLIDLIRAEEPLSVAILDELVKNVVAIDRLRRDVGKLMGLPGCESAVRKILVEKENRVPLGLTGPKRSPEPEASGEAEAEIESRLKWSYDDLPVHPEGEVSFHSVRESLAQLKCWSGLFRPTDDIEAFITLHDLLPLWTQPEARVSAVGNLSQLVSYLLGNFKSSPSPLKLSLLLKCTYFFPVPLAPIVKGFSLYQGFSSVRQLLLRRILELLSETRSASDFQVLHVIFEILKRDPVSLSWLVQSISDISPFLARHAHLAPFIPSPGPSLVEVILHARSSDRKLIEAFVSRVEGPLTDDLQQVAVVAAGVLEACDRYASSTQAFLLGLMHHSSSVREWAARRLGVPAGTLWFEALQSGNPPPTLGRKFSNERLRELIRQLPKSMSALETVSVPKSLLFDLEKALTELLKSYIYQQDRSPATSVVKAALRLMPVDIFTDYELLNRVLEKDDKGVAYEVARFLSRLLEEFSIPIRCQFNALTDEPVRPDDIEAASGIHIQSLKADIGNLLKDRRPENPEWSKLLLPAQSHLELSSVLSSLVLVLTLCKHYHLPIPHMELASYFEWFISTPPLNEEDSACLFHIIMLLEGVELSRNFQIPDHFRRFTEPLTKRFIRRVRVLPATSLDEIEDVEDYEAIFALDASAHIATDMQALASETDNRLLKTRLGEVLLRLQHQGGGNTPVGCPDGLVSADLALAFLLSADFEDPVLISRAVDIVSKDPSKSLSRSLNPSTGTAALVDISKAALNFLMQVSPETLMETRLPGTLYLTDTTLELLGRLPVTTQLVELLDDRWEQLCRNPALLARLSSAKNFPIQKALRTCCVRGADALATLAYLLSVSPDRRFFTRWNEVCMQVERHPLEVLVTVASAVPDIRDENDQPWPLDDIWVLAWTHYSTGIEKHKAGKKTGTWIFSVCNKVVVDGMSLISVDTLAASHFVRTMVSSGNHQLLHHALNTHPRLAALVAPFISSIPPSSHVFMTLSFDLAAAIPSPVLLSGFQSQSNGRAWDACLLTASLCSEARALYMKSLTTADWLSKKGLMLSWTVASASREASQFLLRLPGFVRALLGQRTTEPRDVVYRVLSHLAMLKEARPYFTSNDSILQGSKEELQDPKTTRETVGQILRFLGVLVIRFRQIPLKFKRLGFVEVLNDLGEGGTHIATICQPCFSHPAPNWLTLLSRSPGSRAPCADLIEDSLLMRANICVTKIRLGRFLGLIGQAQTDTPETQAGCGDQ